MLLPRRLRFHEPQDAMFFSAFSIVSPEDRNGIKAAADAAMIAIYNPALTARVSPTMVGSIFLLTASAGLVLTAPQRIPAWCALGAVIATIFTIYYARVNDRSPLYLGIVGLASLFLGVAAPRPTLHFMGVQNIEMWYPETFILIGAAFGMAGFTVINVLHLLIVGELPNIIRSIWGKLFDRFKSKNP